ncbi:MAG: PQQ-binding-like beta-propeller repeat protein [Gemmataceae bacterium]
MKNCSYFRSHLLAFVALVFAGNQGIAEDWPHWLGPKRNGSSPEKNLLTKWPKDGPKVLWKVPGGEGYSTVAVVGDRAYTLVQRKGKELAVCLSVKDDGKQLWEYVLGKAYTNNYGNGPRSTPTIEQGRVYVQSATGPLVCLDSMNGKKMWAVDLVQDFGGKIPTWGFSASPRIEGDLLYVLPGAKKAGVAAYYKKNGKLAWKTGSDPTSYATPVVVKVGGQKQVVFFNAFGLVGVHPKTGKELWRQVWKNEYDCNICTPLVIGSRIFVTCGDKVGCALLELSQTGKPDIVWESKGRDSVMINYWANSVLYKGHLYGIHGQPGEPPIYLRCVNLKTHKVVWEQKFGLGTVTLADGHLWMTTKKGDLVLAKATSEGYQEKGRVRLLGDNRTSPTIANGRLFIRDKQTIYCLDISGK